MSVDFDELIRSTGAMVDAALMNEVTAPSSIESHCDLTKLKHDATALLAVLSSHIPDPDIRQHALALLLCDANGMLLALTKSRADLSALLLNALLLLDRRMREDAGIKDPLHGLHPVCMINSDDDDSICQLGVAGAATRSGGDSTLLKEGDN